jgi:hypothetical protein
MRSREVGKSSLDPMTRFPDDFDVADHGILSAHVLDKPREVEIGDVLFDTRDRIEDVPEVVV